MRNRKKERKSILPLNLKFLKMKVKRKMMTMIARIWT